MAHQFTILLLCVVLVYSIQPSLCIRSLLPANIGGDQNDHERESSVEDDSKIYGQKQALVPIQQSKVAISRPSEDSVDSAHVLQGLRDAKMGDRVLVRRKLPAFPTPPSEPSPGNQDSTQ
ncbi:hypothetical protein O6H91_13G092900 [Diphasiastrum complanatum]|uniref:Uncharacterized protein n=1 Tax=Diphasiastrum complanatum TaxID=34168 RepID=A0ACC2BXA8_DIPCM|nr:hypothetical protein O6H91_13G092900 [Diphasiastrum complanatum]